MRVKLEAEPVAMMDRPVVEPTPGRKRVPVATPGPPVRLRRLLELEKVKVVKGVIEKSPIGPVPLVALAVKAKLGALWLLALRSRLKLDQVEPLLLASTSSLITSVLALCVIIPASGLLTGCVSTWDRTTYESLATSKALIDCAVAGYNHFDADIRHLCAADPQDPAFDAKVFYLPQTRDAQQAIEKARQALGDPVDLMDM